MKVKDRGLWQEQADELRRDGELGEKFLAFFEAWMDRASGYLEDRSEAGYPIGGTDVIGELRSALERVEVEMGFLSVQWIGQMLALAAMHWEYGDQVPPMLTVIERRVMEQETARKLLQLQNEAAGLINPRD